MNELRYTVITDGSSDVVLLPILTWLLRQNGVSCAVQAEWADLRRVRWPKKKPDLADKIKCGLDLYPCDLLFVHRDAEKQPREKRAAEIAQALDRAGQKDARPAVCVIPVHMQEAWLLFDEAAIRRAAGNSSGSQPLELPSWRSIEQIPDPKAVLHDLLRKASGLSGRRLQSFSGYRSAHLVARFTDDFSCLRKLSAFIALESDLGQIVADHHWR